MKNWWQRVARRLGWDGNPLRRGIDRAETMAITSLVIAFIIAGPILAIFAGRAADAAALRQRHAEQGDYRVQAVLRQSAGEAVASSAGLDVAWVRASWTLRDGQQRTGRLATALDAKAGQKAEIWLTPSGRVTRPPLSQADVRDQVMFAILLAVTGLSVVLALGAVAVRVLADRRRMTSWQQDWDTSGPLWSRQG